MASLLYTFDSG